jgi:hypothetical protein
MFPALLQIPLAQTLLGRWVHGAGRGSRHA